MDGSSASKTLIIKPVFLKAGIPLAVSLAGFLYVKIMSTTKGAAKSSVVETKVCLLETIDPQETEATIIKSSDTPDEKVGVEEEEEEAVLSLSNRMEEFEKRECELESKFLRYCVMKEHEIMLLELRNVLLLEANRVEFLDKEVSLMENERQRFQNFVVEYLKVLDQVHLVKLEKGLLQKKVKSFFRKKKELYLVVKEKNLKIQHREAEILRCRAALETKTSEVKELQNLVNQLLVEKNGLLTELNSVEHSDSSLTKEEANGITMEEYNQLVKELEQIQNDRAAETTELSYLRWTNACLRHELMGFQDQQLQQREQKQQEDGEEKHYLELGLTGPTRTNEPSLGAEIGSHSCSKRKKLVQKIKRWVEGCDHTIKPKLDDKGRVERNCFDGRTSVLEEAEEEHLINARRSCSSA